MGLALTLAALGRPGASAPGRVAGLIEVTQGGKRRIALPPIVIYVVGFTEPPPGHAVPQIRQASKRFEPSLVAITAGQSVAFPNRDSFFHNVFSLSSTRKFDLGQFKEGESKERTFPDPGVVDVYCNIHPEMAATILVLPNRRFAFAKADGTFEIDGVPPGKWVAYAYDRFATRPARSEITVSSGTTSAVSFSIEEDVASLKHRNKYGEPYGDPKKYR